MTSLSRNARIAGFVYLLLAIAAPFRLLYIPSTLFVRGDATATAANIAAHEMLFRLGMVSELFCGVVLVFLVLALYRLFKDVDRTLAILVVILGGVLPATIDFIVVLNDAAALILVRGADFLNVFDKPQRDALAMLFLNMHHQQVLIAEILWGLWLFPLGALVFRSGFLPRFLGVWLFVNGMAYLATSLAGLLLPEYLDLVADITFPALLGEIALMLWLVIMGAKDPPAPAKAA
jgi:hypothetical protein